MKTVQFYLTEQNHFLSLRGPISHKLNIGMIKRMIDRMWIICFTDLMKKIGN